LFTYLLTYLLIYLLTYLYQVLIVCSIVYASLVWWRRSNCDGRNSTRSGDHHAANWHVNCQQRS